jgi:4-hydroxybenzoate polyprenyltransferase
MMHIPGCAMMGFAVILGEAVASPIVSAQAAFWGFMTGFLLMGAFMVLNNIDRESKTESQPRRLLPVGDARPNEALSFAIILGSFGLLSAAYLGSSTLLIASLSVAIIITYHAKAKKHGLLGNAFVSANMAITFIFAGFAVGRLTWPLIIFTIMAFLSSMGRETMTSSANVLRDTSGRAESEASSEVYGQAGKQSAELFLAAVATSILPLVLGLVSSYYIPLVVICDVGFLLTSYSMMTSPTRRNVQRNKNYVLVWLSFGLLAFVIGTI